MRRARVRLAHPCIRPHNHLLRPPPLPTLPHPDTQPSPGCRIKSWTINDVVSLTPSLQSACAMRVLLSSRANKLLDINIHYRQTKGHRGSQTKGYTRRRTKRSCFLCLCCLLLYTFILSLFLASIDLFSFTLQSFLPSVFLPMLPPIFPSFISSIYTSQHYLFVLSSFL